MANEPIQGLRYPLPSTSPPDVSRDIKALADDVVTRLVMVFPSVAARDAAIPTPTEGMACLTGTGTAQREWRAINLTGTPEWLNVTNGPWQTYTPTLTASGTNPTLGTGSSVWGRWRYLGGQVVGSFVIQFGTSSVAAGSGNFTIGLPVTRAAAIDSNAPIGTVFLLDASAGSEFVRDLRTTGAMGRSSALVTATSPVPWAASDQLLGNFSYEPAA